MADLGGTFDPGAIKDDRELLPAGDQLAQVFESELVRKDSLGNVVENPADPAEKSRLKLGWEILSGPLQGRKLWTGENVQHPNVQTQEIGQRTLKRICEAAGVGPIRNSEELHFKPMTISITIDPAKGEYGPQNNIKGYKFYGPAARAPAAPQTPQTNGTGQPPPGPAPSTTGKVPWPSR